MSRLWRRHTDGHWKVVQYSAEAESAIYYCYPWVTLVSEVRPSYLSASYVAGDRWQHEGWGGVKVLELRNSSWIGAVNHRGCTRIIFEAFATRCILLFKLPTIFCILWWHHFSKLVAHYIELRVWQISLFTIGEHWLIGESLLRRNSKCNQSEANQCQDWRLMRCEAKSHLSAHRKCWILQKIKLGESGRRRSHHPFR